MQWKLASFVVYWYIRVMKLHNGTLTNGFSSILLHRVEHYQRRIEGKELNTLYWHTDRKSDLSVQFPLFNLMKHALLSILQPFCEQDSPDQQMWILNDYKIIPPKWKMHLVPKVCFCSTVEKLFFLCSKQPFTRLSFPLITHLYSFPGF